MKLFLSFFLSISIMSVSYAHTSKKKKQKSKKNTILVTDSGFGGLSVVEDISKKLKKSGHYKKVNLIFSNALFDKNSGYNSLSSRDEKIKFLAMHFTEWINNISRILF